MWEAVELDVVGHVGVQWKAQCLFRIAVLSAWLRSNAPRLRIALRPFLRGISGALEPPRLRPYPHLGAAF